MLKTLDFKNINYLNVLEWSCTLLAAGMMMAYGFGKYVQFSAGSNSDMKAMKIMWDFYAYSRSFVLIIGFLEIAGSVLLLIPKTRIIGCLFLSTILINIILQDFFFDVPALTAAIMLEILVLFILWLNRKTFVDGFQKLMKLDKKIYTNKLIHVILIGITTIIIFAMFQFIHRNF